MQGKDIIIFDLDGTLAKSKSPFTDTMTGLFSSLLAHKKVAVISGANISQFKKQFLSVLPPDPVLLENLYIMPASGSSLYTWRGDWQEIYSEKFSEEEKNKVLSVLSVETKVLGSDVYDSKYGERIEDRGSQITFSALGQSAPPEIKAPWDPDHLKRDQVASRLRLSLPEFEVRVGGMTSIDITRHGIDKEYGIRKLSEHIKISFDRMLFVGDALFPGGNDAPVKNLGVECLETSGPLETEKIIASWL